jgi:hypothetical protein
MCTFRGMTANTSSSIFRELTAGSIEAIEQRIADERMRKEIEQTDADMEFSDTRLANLHHYSNHKRKGGRADTKNATKKKVPDKDLVAGGKIPSKYKKLFPKQLFGRPVEEIDDFYKTDYVGLCKSSA